MYVHMYGYIFIYGYIHIYLHMYIFIYLHTWMLRLFWVAIESNWRHNCIYIRCKFQVLSTFCNGTNSTNLHTYSHMLLRRYVCICFKNIIIYVDLKAIVNTSNKQTHIQLYIYTYIRVGQNPMFFLDSYLASNYLKTYFVFVEQTIFYKTMSLAI